MAVQLTADQQRAVEHRGESLLVSAAAGSGKTKVLVERLFGYILQDGAAVDDFLIITYTKAAAAELRSRIAAELSQRVAQQSDNAHLRRQLFRVYRADIKTVDAFCAALLRENIYLLPPVGERSYTPDFRVLDEQEAKNLRLRVLGRVLEDFYAGMDESDRLLADTLGAGRDDHSLEQLVLDTHNKLQSHPYPLRSLEQMEDFWRTPPQSLRDTPYGQELCGDVADKALFWAQKLEDTAAALTDEAVIRAYADRFIETAGQLRRLAACPTWAEMAACPVSFRRMGVVRGESEEKEQAKAVLSLCKEELKKITDLFDVTEEQHCEDLAAMAPAMLSLLHLTAQFSRRYQSEKARMNAMDFSDQEHYAIALLLDENGAPTELARRVAGRYREIMVDEYQDTNEVQNCIFNAISCEGKNLFTVGDVKQSIYRFRLADPGIFLEKYNAYADCGAADADGPRRILLSCNFRSRQGVLDSSNFIFRNIMSRRMGEMDYGRDEQLYFGANYYPAREDEAAEYHFIDVEDGEDEHFDRGTVEAEFVAGRIGAMLSDGFPVSDGDGGFRPCRAEDIVILMRSPRSRLAAFAAALQRRGIPCDAEEPQELFSTVEIAVVYSLMQIIDNPRQDVPLISVLRSPLFGFHADRLAMIRAQCREGEYYDALCADTAEDTAAFLRQLEALRALAREESVEQLVWHIYNEFHCLAVFGAMDGGALRRENLLTFYDYVRTMAAVGKRSLFDFLNHLRGLLQNGETPPLSARREAHGVRIMSIHKSKGLEFPIVFLCDLSKRFDPRDTQSAVLVHPRLGLGCERVDIDRGIRYDTVSKQAVASVLRREGKAEEMRILYVAMTRAQEKLIAVDCRRHGRKRLGDLMGLAALPVPPEAVESGKCLGDWLALPLLCSQEGAPLREYAEREMPVTLCPAEGWEVYFHKNPAPEEDDCAVQSASPQQAEQTVDAAALEMAYAYAVAARTPSKVTATQLKGRAVDEELQEGRMPGRQRAVSFEKPRFLAPTLGLSAAERGTAVHAAMQYLDLNTPATEEAVSAAVSALAERRLLRREQAEAVDCGAIVRFLASPLCHRIRSAEKVYREYRFALLVDAALVDEAAAGEEMVLQGVADCAFVENGKLVIVDFKTDRVSGAALQERSESYRSQLTAYADALSQILELPVAEKILYFFHTNSAISL